MWNDDAENCFVTTGLAIVPDAITMSNPEVNRINKRGWSHDLRRIPG